MYAVSNTSTLGPPRFYGALLLKEDGSRTFYNPYLPKEVQIPPGEDPQLYLERLFQYIHSKHSHSLTPLMSKAILELSIDTKKYLRSNQRSESEIQEILCITLSQE